MTVITYGASDIAGANIRTYRKKRGLTVAQLAERCALIGGPGAHLTAPVIENIEHGRKRNGKRTRSITIDELIAISGALGLGPAVLLPTLANTMEYPDDEALMILDTLLGNMEAVRELVEQVRDAAAAAIPTARATAASLTVTPVFHSGPFEAGVNPNPVIDHPAED